MDKFLIELTPAEVRALSEVIGFVDISSDDIRITDITGLTPDAFEVLRKKVGDVRDQVRGVGL